MLPTDGFGDLRLVVDAVLERDDGRVRAEERPEGRGCGFRVIRFDAEQHDVHWTDVGRVVGRVEILADRPIGGLDRQAVAAERFEMGAACDQMDLGAAACEARPVVRPDAARPEDGDPHQTRSMAMATEPPPPRHRVASP